VSNEKRKSVARGSAVIKNVISDISDAHIVGNFTATADLTIRRHKGVYWLSNDPKIFDLE